MCPIEKNKENPEFTKYLILMIFVCFNYPKKKAMTALKDSEFDEIIQ